MRVEPVKGMCLVVEDKQDALSGASALKASGFTDVSERSTGVTGRVYAVGENEHGLKAGDHVIYSKFVAEQILLKDESGNEIEGLKSVPTDAVIGRIL